jgi:membrane protein required for colicin V production
VFLFIDPKKLNWLDLIIVILITIPTFFGFRKGFWRKFLGIAGIVAGFILAVRFYEPVSVFINKFINGNALIFHVISFLLIIGIIHGFSVWVARFIAGSHSGTSWLDKIAGSVFGFFQGLILASVLLVNLSFINLPDARVRGSSLLYSRVYHVAPVILEKVISYSPDLKHIYEDYKQKFLPGK